MKNPVLSLSAWWGRQIARYGRWAVSKSDVIIENMPAGNRFIIVDWHSYNLVGIAAFRLHTPWVGYVFGPPGIVGTAATHWHLEAGLNVVPLPADGEGNVTAALKGMAKGLDNGGTPIISVDGPHGPAWKTRPGALWIARLTGAPLIPIGFAASPEIHFPRWDRHLIPTAGCKINIVFGDPIYIDRKQEILDEHLDQVGVALNDCCRRATEKLQYRL